MLQTEITAPNGTSERAVVVPSSDLLLRGVLGFPSKESDHRDVSVLCLHGWGGGRCGPHDLLTGLTRAFNAAGFSTLRFDFADRGESDHLPTATTLDQMGEDALAAAHFLATSTKRTKIMILGMCSGGNVGIGILDRLPGCSGLFLISVYPFSDGDSFGRQSHRTAVAAKGYVRKALQLHTWKRLFRGAIDFKSIFAVLFGHYKRNEAQVSEVERKGKSPIDNLTLRTIPVHMIYGEADPDTTASLLHFQNFAKTHDLPVSFETVPAADHNFYSATGSQRVTQTATAFAANL